MSKQADKGQNLGKLDQSKGFSTRDQYVASLKAQASTGKLNRHLKRAMKSLRKKDVK